MTRLTSAIHATPSGRKLSEAAAAVIAEHGKPDLLEALSDHWNAVADSMGDDAPFEVMMARQIAADYSQKDET